MFLRHEEDVVSENFMAIRSTNDIQDVTMPKLTPRQYPNPNLVATSDQSIRPDYNM